MKKHTLPVHEPDELELALEDVEDLLVGMPMQAGARAGSGDLLHDGELAAGFLAAGLDRADVAEQQELPSLARREVSQPTLRLSRHARDPTVHGNVSDIVARWEWRAFGEDFGPAEERLAALEPERVRRATRYTSCRREATLRSRSATALMDVKHLEEVNDDGLEQWLPVLKGGFPLAAGDAAAVLDELGVARRRSTATAYTLDELIDEVVGRAGAARGRRAQAADALHGQRLHGRALTDVRTAAGDAHDRGRVEDPAS